MSSVRLLVNGHHYDLQSSGGGEALLLLHGFSGDKTNWAVLRTGLQDKYRVIAVDILGHGASDKPSQVCAFRMERVACDIVSLLDEMQIPECHLLGYSMGGRLALHLAMHYPARCRSLILESASPGLAVENEREQRRRDDESLAERIQTMGVTWLVDYWERLPPLEITTGLARKYPVSAAQTAQKQRRDGAGQQLAWHGQRRAAQPVAANSASDDADTVAGRRTRQQLYRD